MNLFDMVPLVLVYPYILARRLECSAGTIDMHMITQYYLHQEADDAHYLEP